VVERIGTFLWTMEFHLLYASLVWLAAWLLTSSRGGSATAKYWIWVATSINFLLPFSAIPLPVRISTASGKTWTTPGLMIAATTWAIGTAVMIARLIVRVRIERSDDAATSFLADGVPVRFSASRRVPAVEGILRPRICLPVELERVLTRDELDAVLLHELRHAKRRDNLIRLLHEVSVCLFWFHPLVWMTGARLALYRELSCDESVMRRADGRDLVSALAKLAAPDDALLLQASASSFLADRLASLTAAAPPRHGAANAILATSFAVVLLGGALGPVMHPVCAGVKGGVAGGVKGGVKGGVAGGIAGGVTGGIKGGVRGGVQGGVAGGIR
jgi:beta-lactamase regulating signal transducer with metallopeptidase domain